MTLRAVWHSCRNRAVLMIALPLAAAACSPRAESAAAPTDETPASYHCPLTVPVEPYLAAAPYPRQPPGAYHAVWYGNDDLWTMLDPGGEVWRALPKQGHSFTQKTFWWSRKFGTLGDERQPLIAVTGTRLDAPGTFSAGNPGTHAIADFGTAMLVGIDIPASGCWEIRARYRGAELAYVVRVDE